MNHIDLITRSFIHPKIQFAELHSKELTSYDFNKFNDAINFWKIVLYEGYGLRSGNTMCIYDSTVGFLYSSLFFAAAELGIEMITPPEKAYNNTGYVEHLEVMTKESGLFDLAIFDDINMEQPKIVAMGKRYCKKILNEKIFFDYKIKDHELYKHLSTNILATPDSVLVQTTTSGTTGEPKILKYTHKQLYRISVRNIDVMEYRNNSVCHTRNLHHSFILLTHFLPAMIGSSKHYSFPLGRWDNIDEFIDLVRQEKISKIALSYKGLLDEILLSMTNKNIQFDHNVDFIVGGFHVKPEYITLANKTNIQNIVSLFGTNETFGPLFVKHIKKDQDLSNYRPDWYPPTDGDFFTISSVENRISVTAKSIDIKDIVVEDTLIGDNITGYIHKGRENLFRINEIYFTIPELHETVVPYCDGDFDICVDASNQKLYLAVWSGDVEFEKLNLTMRQKFRHLQFNNYAKLHKDNYSGFKVNMSVLRNYFRNLKK